MADRKKEKEKLMEKVFGKDAPNRRLTEEDMELLRNSLLDIDQLSPEWKTLKENSEKLQQQSQKILDSFTDADLEQLRNEIRKDFGDSLPVEAREELTVVHSQLPLNAKYEEIEARLNEEVLCQKDYNHKLVVAFRRPTIMGFSQAA